MVLRDWDAEVFAARWLSPEPGADPPRGACYLMSFPAGPRTAKIKAYRMPQPADRTELRILVVDGGPNYCYTLASDTIFGPVKEYKFVWSGEYLVVRVPDQFDPDRDVWINIARSKRRGREWSWFCHAVH